MTMPTKSKPSSPIADTTDEVSAPAGIACPHCKKTFEATVDAAQPPRLQGAKCPNCKLFVPARLIQQRPPLTRAERLRRG